MVVDLIPAGDQTGTGNGGMQKPRNAVGPSWRRCALDVRTQTLLVPVGSVAPDFHPEMRPGANLFTSSLVALDATRASSSGGTQLVKNDYHDGTLWR